MSNCNDISNVGNNFCCHLNNVHKQYSNPGVPWTRTYRFINATEAKVNSHDPISYCNTQHLLTKHEKLLNKKTYIFNNANNRNTTSGQLTNAQKYSMLARGHSASGYRRTTYASQSETHTNNNSSNRHQPHSTSLHICPYISYYDDTYPPWPGPPKP